MGGSVREGKCRGNLNRNIKDNIITSCYSIRQCENLTFSFIPACNRPEIMMLIRLQYHST